MVDEHFGINVVEFMVSLLHGSSPLSVDLQRILHSSQAAGLITLSHASAGPLLDIAVPSSSGQITGECSV